MVNSFVMEDQKIKFPNADLVVDQNGINKLSDPNAQFNKIKIDPKKMKVSCWRCRRWKCWARGVRGRSGGSCISMVGRCLSLL